MVSIWSPVLPAVFKCPDSLRCFRHQEKKIAITYFTQLEWTVALQDAHKAWLGQLWEAGKWEQGWKHCPADLPKIVPCCVYSSFGLERSMVPKL